MTYEAFKLHALRLPHAWPDFPFNSHTLAVKVGSKIFALTDSLTFDFINLKCKPETSLVLQAKYEGIKPAYHMNKKHWISVYINAGISDALIVSLMQDSYTLVYSTIPKKEISGLQQDSRTLKI